jgi:hypothetical protein
MLVLNLCQKFCPEKIDFPLSSRLGDGADGEVFELKDTTDKVIKFSVLYEYPGEDLDTKYDQICRTLDFIKMYKPDSYARVYEHKTLGRYTRPFAGSNQGQKYILYYYFMEKLLKISEDEKRVFHSILSHEDKNLNKNFSINKIKKMLTGMSMGLDFDEKKVILFVESLKMSKVCHNDLHVRNIMKDFNGNFKLIDFDRSYLLG